VEVVQAQVRLVAQLLEERFDADYAFVNDQVITLDPGTTYPGRPATRAARVARQRPRYAGNSHPSRPKLTPLSCCGTLWVLGSPSNPCREREMPPDGVHVYLTDTLESPRQPPPAYPMLYKELGEEYKRAQKVKADVPVLVVLGNPPL
jgi:hypothetical protein